jgi:ADP-ribose pyrophosphatase
MPAAPSKEKAKSPKKPAESRPEKNAKSDVELKGKKDSAHKADKSKNGKGRRRELPTKKAQKTLPVRSSENARVLSSKVSYQGPLFRVLTEEVSEPDGKQTTRDVIRHNGSVVILAVDSSKSKKDPRVIMEQQYRHAAGQYLIELPAGKLEPGEDSLDAAKRELIEETGYRAKHWTKLVRYFASPGFLGEWMQVYLAEGLSLGEAEPEEDESIDVAAIPMSKILKLIEKGKILDGKTLVSLMLYDRLRRGK